jgi:hypothetical protein
MEAVIPCLKKSCVRGALVKADCLRADDRVMAIHPKTQINDPCKLNPNCSGML